MSGNLKLAPILSRFCPAILVFLSAQSLTIAAPVKHDADQKAFYNDMHQALTMDLWPKCISICQTYLSRHKSDPVAHVLRGYALLMSNHDAQALSDLNTAIAGGITVLPQEIAEDHSTNIWSLRGFALLRVGRIKEGIVDLERSLRLNPRLVNDFMNQRSDFMNLAAAYSRLGDGARAAQFQRSGEAREKEMQFIFQPSVASAAQANSEVLKLKRLVASAPGSSLLVTRLAAHQLYLKEYAEALKNIDKAISLEPYLTRARMMRFEILKTLKRDREAAVELDSILKLTHRPTGSAFGAGDKIVLSSQLLEICRRYGDLDGQIRVLQSDSDDGTAGESQLYDLGRCYVGKKQWAKAIEAYSDALDYAVDNRPLIYDARAKAHKMLGHAKQAQADETEANRLRHKNTKI